MITPNITALSSGSQGTKGHRVFEGRHSPLCYHPMIVPICRIIFYFHAI